MYIYLCLNTFLRKILKLLVVLDIYLLMRTMPHFKDVLESFWSTHFMCFYLWGSQSKEARRFFLQSTSAVNISELMHKEIVSVAYLRKWNCPMTNWPGLLYIYVLLRTIYIMTKFHDIINPSYQKKLQRNNFWNNHLSLTEKDCWQVTNVYIFFLATWSFCAVINFRSILFKLFVWTLDLGGPDQIPDIFKIETFLLLS